ncbi:MAG: hypothetical protein A3K67_00930 [Euryarchaeota archaeon RBG_16_62_10]|nr:MAG: hypothetical protein A3K67_00930 [Euryarchaeota archaeon RBG_16_62_10]
MAHIHLEDGAFSLPWLAIWSAIALGVLGLALLLLRKRNLSPRALAIAAMCASVGFAASQIEIPVFGGLHLNLTPLIGILVGPSLGTLCALVINVFGAAIGHGGWGMISVNTIVNSIEVLIGFYAYRAMRGTFRAGRFTSGFTAATGALVVSAFAVAGIVLVSGLQDSQQTGEEALPSIALLLAANVVTGVIEGFVTGYIVSFIGKVRPDLLAHAEETDRTLPAAPAEGGPAGV